MTDRQFDRLVEGILTLLAFACFFALACLA